MYRIISLQYIPEWSLAKMFFLPIAKECQPSRFSTQTQQSGIPPSNYFKVFRTQKLSTITLSQSTENKAAIGIAHHLHPMTHPTQLTPNFLLLSHLSTSQFTGILPMIQQCTPFKARTEHVICTFNESITMEPTLLSPACTDGEVPHTEQLLLFPHPCSRRRPFSHCPCSTSTWPTNP